MYFRFVYKGYLDVFADSEDEAREKAVESIARVLGVDKDARVNGKKLVEVELVSGGPDAAP